MYSTQCRQYQRRQPPPLHPPLDPPLDERPRHYYPQSPPNERTNRQNYHQQQQQHHPHRRRHFVDGSVSRFAPPSYPSNDYRRRQSHYRSSTSSIISRPQQISVTHHQFCVQKKAEQKLVFYDDLHPLKTKISAIKDEYRRSHFDEPKLLRKIINDTIRQHHGCGGTHRSSACDSDGNPCTPDSMHSDDDDDVAAHDVPMAAPEQVHWGRSDDADGSRIYHKTKDLRLVDMQAGNGNQQLNDDDCDSDDDDHVLIQYTEKGWHRQMMIDAPRDIMIDGNMLLQKATVSKSAQHRKTSKKKSKMNYCVHEHKPDFCLFQGDGVYKDRKRGKCKHNRKIVHCSQQQQHQQPRHQHRAHSGNRMQGLQALSQQQHDCLQARQVRHLIDSKMHAYAEYVNKPRS